MTGYQAQVVIDQLRRSESLLLPLVADEKEHPDELHDAKIHIWKAIERLGKVADE